MIKISKKADYAVMIMASLAHRRIGHDVDRRNDLATEDANDGQVVRPASAQEIADGTGLSRALVANLLKALTRAELLESVRGASGGYRIRGRLEDINLAQIITAVEGPIRIVECASAIGASSHDCDLSDHCPSRSAMRLVHDRIANLMEDIHLPELLRLENRGTPTLPL